MGTAVATKAIVLTIPPTLLGPESDYERGRIALKGEYNPILVESQKITAINSQEDAEKVNNLCRVLQAATKDSEIFFKPIKQQIDGFKKPILDHEKEFALPIDSEKRRLSSLSLVWEDKCAREKEERDRIAREAAEAQAKKDAEDAALAEAALLDAAGDKEGADELLSKPVEVDFVPVVTQSEAPAKMPGQVVKMNYSATVIDFRALVRAVVDGKAPWQCIVANESFLNGKARLEQDGFNVPGVLLNKTKTLHHRS